MNKIIGSWEHSLDIKNPTAVMCENIRMVNKFGYLPVEGPTVEEIKTGQWLLSCILREYPGYKWVITIQRGFVSLVNETLDPYWGCNIKEGKLDSDGKVIRYFAGKLLEGFNLRRGKMNVEEVQGLERNGRGQAKRICDQYGR